jgi:beta-phosphoglucomutase-like phosphatase (HAD superfamily)
MLLDLDGTIADTEPVWLDAKARVARRHRIVWSEADGLASVGQPTPVYAAEFARRGAAASAERIAEEITEEVVAGLGAGIVWRPGALHLLATAAANDVPTALVTMAYRPIAEAVRELTTWSGRSRTPSRTCWHSNGWERRIRACASPSRTPWSGL